MKITQMSSLPPQRYEITPERRRNHQSSIRNYMRNNTIINKEGYIDQNKLITNIRFITLNARGLDPSNNIKIERFIKSIQKYQIDIMLINEVNMKWTPANIDRMEQKLRVLGREIKVVPVDSSVWSVSKKNYLPGGVLTAIRGKFRSLIEEEHITKGPLGNWIGIKIKHKGKSMVIINVYRIPNSSHQGPTKSLTQYNILEGNAKTSTEIRRDTLNQIKQYVNINNVDDVIIAGDLNESVNSREIRKFFREIGVEDAHSRINNIALEEMDRTCINGNNPIDTFAVSEGLIEYVEGVKLVPHNEIVNSDHRAYIVDINIEEYFEDEFSYWNSINHVLLNPAKKSHREKFSEELEMQLDIHQIETLIENCPNPTYQQIETIDEIITLVLNKATKKVEGQKRNVPYSARKAQCQGEIKYWKLRGQKEKGLVIDTEELNKLEELYAINNNEGEGREYCNLKLNDAKEKWSQMKEKGKEYREQELLDLYPNELMEDQSNDEHQRKVILRKMIKEQQRKYAFKYITKHIGKGSRKSLIRLHEMDQNQQIIRTHIEKEAIEQAIIDQNKKHFKMAHESNMYKDKVYPLLQQDSVRNKILRGRLVESDCDNKDVFEFLKLLKNPTQCNQPSFKPITEEEWIREVKRSKKRSSSSIFSKRTYSVYKCAILSARMTSILVWFYNILLAKNYYPKRWMNQVDTSLEKGKGPVLGKLRFITLIEGDLQLNMRIHLASNKEELIEKDNRFSKANYGSRKNYSIETAILQKRLIFDNSLIEMKPSIYNFTDLKSCYDRQLANVGSIVEESVGRNRAAMKLYTKIMPKFKRYISTGYGISEQYYGGEEDQLAGTGQGNKFSGDMCRDISCIIIKVIENKRLGVVFENQATGERIQCVSVAFVDDTDFMTNGENSVEKITKIIQIYEKLHGATGGLIELTKTTYYAWTWKWKQGQKIAKKIETNLSIKGNLLKQNNINESVLTLGIQMNPMLVWDKQFEMMKEKLCRAMSKLRSTPLSVGNAYVFVNMYLIKQVYFGTGVIAINKNQEEILKKISEPVILRKLGLSEKFPRRILYTKKSQLGVGILQPSTIIAILALQLYLGHKRSDDNIGKQISINEVNTHFQYGYSKNILETEEEIKPQNKIWSDEIGSRLLNRNIVVINATNEIYISTKNKTIMDYAEKYVRCKEIGKNILAPLNHVRLWKQMVLPCELIGLTGTKRTKACQKIESKSSLKWRIPFPTLPKPSKKSVEIWSEFIQWIVNKDIVTILDFCDKCESKYQISEDEQYLRERINNSFVYFEKEDERYGRSKYKETEECSVQNWRRVIGERESNGFMQIDSIFPPEYAITNSTNNVQYEADMPEKIKASIENEKAQAATDASLKLGRMGGHWIVTDEMNEEIIENTIYHKAWRNNTNKGAEAIVLLELITMLHKRGKNITRGKITIAIDNRKVHNGVTIEIVKASTYNQDAGAEIAQIRRLLNEIRFKVEFKLVKIKKGTPSQFMMNPGDHLLKICDQKAKIMRMQCYERDADTNIKYVGYYSLRINGEMSTNSVKEAIRKRDAEMIFEEYVRKKFRQNADFIDLEARNSFKHKDITPSVIKCMHGYNHYGVRDALINGKTTGIDCPRCNHDETWEHVIKCKSVRHMQRQFLKELYQELTIVSDGKVNNETIMKMMKDIAVYLNGGEEEEYTTSQQYIGIQELFRGYVVKDWIGANFNCNVFSELNVILVIHAVKFYIECWEHRNEIFHNETKQRSRMINWYIEMKEEIESNDPQQVQLFVRRTALDLNRCNTDTIRTWIQNVIELRKKVKKLPKGDIRRFYEVR